MYFWFLTVFLSTYLQVHCRNDMITTFHNLTHLEIISLNYSWKFLVQILNHCPKLQSLGLDQVCYCSYLIYLFIAPLRICFGSNSILQNRLVSYNVRLLTPFILYFILCQLLTGWRFQRSMDWKRWQRKLGWPRFCSAMPFITPYNLQSFQLLRLTRWASACKIYFEECESFTNHENQETLDIQR